MNSSTQHQQDCYPRRRFFKKCLLILFLIIGIAALYTWLIQRLPDLAVEQIGKLTQTNIRVKSIRLSLNGSVQIKDLLILPKSEGFQSSPILKADTVQADFSRSSLLWLRPKLKNIVISNFLFDIQLDLNKGLWNIGDLSINIPKGRGGGQMPSIHLQNGVLRYSKLVSGQVDVVASLPLEAFFELNEITEKGYHFKFMTGGVYENIGKSTLSGYWKPGRVTITGGMSSQDTPSMEQVWSIGAMAAELDYDQDRHFTFSTNIRNLKSRRSPGKAFQNIPIPILDKTPSVMSTFQTFLDRYQPSGTIDIELTSEGNLSTLAESQFNGRINCLDVSILDKKFPYAIDHLSGAIRFENQHFSAEQLTGLHDQTRIDIGFSRDTSVKPANYSLRIHSDNMQLNQDVYSALNDRHKKNWDRVNPHGQAQIIYERSRNDSGSRQKLSVQLTDASITYTGFPYPLEHLKGEVVFTPEKTVFSNLISRFGDRQIILEGRILNQVVADRCQLNVRADNVPLNTTLANALPLSLKKAYEQLQLSGWADAVIAIQSDPNQPDRVITTSHLTLHQATLHILDKQLPLKDSEGTLTLTPTSVQIHSLKGTFFGSPLSIQGSMTLDDQSKLRAYDLTIDSRHMTIEGLTAALPEKPVSIIQRFQPKGSIGLKSNLRRSHDTDSLLYNATVDCNGLSIVPKLFAYTLKAYSGQLLIDNNRIQLSNVLALPAEQMTSKDASDTPGLLIDGTLTMTDGRLQAGQLNISGKELLPDSALGEALPPPLASFYSSLRPSGQISIDPSRVQLTATPEGIIHIDYWATVHLKNCEFITLGTSGKLSGLVEATGHYATQGGLKGGVISLSASNISVNDKVATNLTTLLRYQPEKHLWQSNDLLADFYEGKIAGELSFGLDTEQDSESRIQLTVTDANLHQFLSASSGQTTKEIQTSVGTMNGYLSIVTPLKPGASRIGRCLFNISQMKVGKVSPIFKLISALQLAESSDYQFENMLIDSYILGNQLYIEKFDLSGESLALSGKGTLEWPDDQLQLTLLARGKRLALSEPSVLQSLTEGLVGTVMRVDVSGTLQDPVVVRKVPVLEDSFKLLGTPPQ